MVGAIPPAVPLGAPPPDPLHPDISGPDALSDDAMSSSGLAPDPFAADPLIPDRPARGRLAPDDVRGAGQDAIGAGPAGRDAEDGLDRERPWPRRRPPQRP